MGEFRSSNRIVTISIMEIEGTVEVLYVVNKWMEELLVKKIGKLFWSNMDWGDTLTSFKMKGMTT